MKRKASRVEIRVSKATVAKWRRAARAADMSLSDWIRRRCGSFVQGRTYALCESTGSYRVRWGK